MSKLFFRSFCFIKQTDLLSILRRSVQILYDKMFPKLEYVC